MGKQTTPAEWAEKFKRKIPATSEWSDPQPVPDVLTLAMLKEAADRLKQSGTSSYKEKPMELFKFTTTKPSAEVIWDTLLKADILKHEGVPPDYFRFAMFCILQLEPDFKKAKKIAIGTSRVYDAAMLLGITKDQFLSINTNIPTHYPSWVDLSLYQPYYLAKQLFHTGAQGSDCFEKLFDRSRPDMSLEESSHIDVDSAYNSIVDSTYLGLTSWMLDNVPVDYYFQHSIKINSTSTKIPVESKDGMVTFIKDQLQKSIEATYNHLIPVGAFPHIPEFTLVPDSYDPGEVKF